MTRGSTTTTYAYDLNNRLLGETTGTTVKSYTYDVDGNTLTAGNESYTYDVRNRQIGYTDGTTTASYVYNPKGLRSQKTVGGATKYFVWDGMNIVYEYDASAGTAYYYGLYRVSAGNSQYYLYNAHGDVVQLTDGSGTVTKSYAYDAFGNEVNPSASDTNPFRYCGEYYDVETGAIYLRARYYDPSTGRFTQQDAWAFMDASDPLGLNLYTYCANNPILYIDPTGNSFKDSWMGALLAFDEILTDGFTKWVIGKMHGGDVYYQWEDESDYYLGRMVGDMLGIAYGTGMSLLSITQIFASILGGGAITLTTGGTAVITGYAVAVDGIVIGVAGITAGTLLYAKSFEKIEGDYIKYENAQNNHIGHQNGKAPRNNQKQNKQIKDIANQLGLNKDQIRRLHDKITGKGYSYQEILELAKEMFNK